MYRFNRSNANCLFPTKRSRLVFQCLPLMFQSLKRELPLSHDPLAEIEPLAEVLFQSLKRELPLSHPDSRGALLEAQ